MSSFIVSDRTINRVLGFLEMQCRSFHLESVLKESGSTSLDELGAKMFLLNVKGTSTRYPGEAIKELPGEIGHVEYEGYEYEEANQFQALKSLACFLYQCAEGDNDKQPLFLILAKLKYAWAMEIISAMPEYDRAEWD